MPKKKKNSEGKKQSKNNQQQNVPPQQGNIPAQSGNVLHGWKQIADFLNVDERTVRRWKQDGLPYYQLKKRGRVFAYENELKQWFNNRKNRVKQPCIQTYQSSGEQNTQNNKTKNKILAGRSDLKSGFLKKPNIVVIAFSLFVLSVITIFSFNNKKSRIYKTKGIARLFCKVTEFNNRKRFSVFNQKNEEVLTLAYENTNKFAENKRIQYFDIGDLNGDGLEDFVFFPLDSESNNTLFVYLQNKRGKLDLFLKKTIIEKAMFEGKNIELNHIHLVRIVDLNKDGKGEIAICLSNCFFYPSAILFFDYKLEKKLLEITHPGWFFDLAAMDLNNDGTNEVYICATNNYLQHKKSEQVAIAIDLKGLDCKKISINNPLKKGLNPGLKCTAKVVYVRFGFNENIIDYSVWQYPLFNPNKNNKENMLLVRCDNFQTDKLFQKSKWWEVTLRGFFFTYMLKKAEQPFWNDAYLEKLKIKIPEKDYKKLLKCRYFNGKGWQENFCYYPTE